MLQDAIRRTGVIAELAGVRELLTGPIDAAADASCLRFGLVPSPVRVGQLFQLFKVARWVLCRLAEASWACAHGAYESFEDVDSRTHSGRLGVFPGVLISYPHGYPQNDVLRTTPAHSWGRASMSGC